MTKEISTKHFVLVLVDGTRFFLDDKEAEGVKNAMRSEIKFLEIGENMVMVAGISRLVTGSNFEEAQRIKQGDWYCKKHENWLARGVKCGYC